MIYFYVISLSKLLNAILIAVLLPYIYFSFYYSFIFLPSLLFYAYRLAALSRIKAVAEDAKLRDDLVSCYYIFLLCITANRYLYLELNPFS